MPSSVIAPALLALAVLCETVSAIRNITTPPVIIPLSFGYNTSFSRQAPGRFIAPISIGTPAQTLNLALDLSRPDNEIRHDFAGLPDSAQFRDLLFKNSSSSTFVWGSPENDINGWLGNGPTDNITLGNLVSFPTGWNRWNHTETINLSPEQREEMLAYGISGSLGVHGPACAVDGGSWFTSLVADGGAPFRAWGMYFTGGLDAPDSNNRVTHLDGDSPDYSAMLFLGGYQPSKFTGNLTMVGNITYNNASPVPITSTSLPRDPHILRIEQFTVNAASIIRPTAEEGIFILTPNSIFSNFTTRAQAASFASAVGATARNLGGGRTQYTFPNCTAPEPTQNVEVVFPVFPAGATTPAQRIAIPPSSLKILMDGVCYLSFQEPWDTPIPAVGNEQTEPQLPRGTLGLSFLRNAYIHTDYDAGAYFMAPRSTAPPTTSNVNSVYRILNPPAFVLDQCWNSPNTPTGVIKGEYQESWYSFPVAFMEYYAPIIGPPWIYRISVRPTSVTVVLALLILPLGIIICLILAWVNNRVGHTVVGKPSQAPPGKR